MKKIFGVLVVLCFSFIGYSHGLYSDQCSGGKVYRAEGTCGSCSSCDGIMYGNTGMIGCDVIGYKKCCPVGSVINSRGKCVRCDSLTSQEAATLEDTSNCRGSDCAHPYTLENGTPACCLGVLDDNGHCLDTLSQYGINISTDCLLNGQCSLNVYKVLGIRKQDQNPTVLGFFQDITLASTTAILGTVIIIAIIISGLFFAFASITGKDTKRAKSILIDAFVGLLLVMGSYTIIRLIQFLATAGS